MILLNIEFSPNKYDTGFILNKPIVPQLIAPKTINIKDNGYKVLITSPHHSNIII